MFLEGGQTLFPGHVSRRWTNHETLFLSHVSRRWEICLLRENRFQSWINSETFKIFECFLICL
jgi:hypothetical protein